MTSESRLVLDLRLCLAWLTLVSNFRYVDFLLIKIVNSAYEMSVPLLIRSHSLLIKNIVYFNIYSLFRLCIFIDI